MNIKDFIRAEKTDLDTGAWAAGHIPRTAFPLSRLRDKRYKYGPDYRWRLVRFAALGERCRVLIQYNASKEIVRARFGVERNGDMVVLCSHEFHASEPGWHCHVTFDDVDIVPPGAARDHTSKWPKPHKDERLQTSEPGVLSSIAARFGFKAQGELL